MPCTCDGYPNLPDEHNGPLAEMLCKVMAEHEANGEMECFNKEQRKWWREHKARDRERIREDVREAKSKADKAKVLSKLSPYEKRLLGF